MGSSKCYRARSHSGSQFLLLRGGYLGKGKGRREADLCASCFFRRWRTRNGIVRSRAAGYSPSRCSAARLRWYRSRVRASALPTEGPITTDRDRWHVRGIIQDAAAQTPFLAAISKSIAVGCFRWAHRASLRIHIVRGNSEFESKNRSSFSRADHTVRRWSDAKPACFKASRLCGQIAHFPFLLRHAAAVGAVFGDLRFWKRHCFYREASRLVTNQSWDRFGCGPADLSRTNSVGPSAQRCSKSQRRPSICSTWRWRQTAWPSYLRIANRAAMLYDFELEAVLQQRRMAAWTLRASAKC